MHVALLTDGISPYVTGGMQRHSYHLAANMLAAGIKVTLVHTVPEGDAFPSEKEVAKLLSAPEGLLEVIAVPFPKAGKVPGHYIKESYKYSCAIYETLEGQWANFDFIYAKGFTAWCLLEKKKKGIHIAPVGVKFHGYEMFQKTKGLKGRLAQFMLKPPVVFNSRHANVVFSYGGEITNIIRGIGVEEEKIVEIGSAVSESWILDKPKPSEGPLKFVFVGRNERRKGIVELMKCSELFAQLNIEMHWVGPIEDKNSHSNHVFHGEIKDGEKLKAILDQCQVLVAPSYSEGMPNVILEAMSRGLAIISTKVGAVPKMVSEDNGLLIKSGSVSALRDAIKHMAKLKPEDLDTLRKNSIEKVRADFNWKVVAQRTIDTIKRVTYSVHNSEYKQ